MNENKRTYEVTGYIGKNTTPLLDAKSFPEEIIIDGVHRLKQDKGFWPKNDWPPDKVKVMVIIEKL